MLQELALRRGQTMAETEAWLSDNDYRLHHAGGQNAQVVPGEIHDRGTGVAHTGARSDNARIPAARPRGVRRGTATSRAVGVLSAYLTLRDALQALEIAHPDRVPINGTYYHTDGGGVFVIQTPAWFGLFSGPKKVYVAGAMEGRSFDIPTGLVDYYQREGERLYGRHIEGGPFRQDRFIPGTLRRRLLLTDRDGRIIGHIDETGEHYYPVPFPWRS